jgi:large subunit ribosomal protein L35
MPKMKTHKGSKKRFKVSATGKVSHKRCGSSHLMSHKNGKQVRKLRRKSYLTVAAEAQRLRHALGEREHEAPEVYAAGGYDTAGAPEPASPPEPSPAPEAGPGSPA